MNPIITAKVNEDLFFSNPLDVHNIGDPFILKASDGKFYLYATSDADNGFKVWSSEDMIKWKVYPMKAYSKSRETWGNRDFWAPEVYEWNGLYHMYYSANWKKADSLRVGHAISESPTGPFVDVSDEPMFDLGYAVIDGHVFVEDNGRAFFYFSRDCSENIVGLNHESHIYGVELESDRHTFIGTPKVLTTPTEEWEKASGDYRWNEGPFVVKKNDVYYLNYSGNFYGGKDYSVGYATAEDPFGPFVKNQDSRLLFSEEAWKDISGSGHNMLLPIQNTDLFYSVYHTHTVASIGGGSRSLNIGIIGIDESGRMYSNAPHYGRQLKPKYYEKALKFKDNFSVHMNGQIVESLTNNEISLFTSKNDQVESVELYPQDYVEIKFDKISEIDTLLLYTGTKENQLKFIDLELSNGSLVQKLSFSDVPGEPAIVSFDDLKVDWIRIKNVSDGTGDLSEIIILPRE